MSLSCLPDLLTLCVLWLLWLENLLSYPHCPSTFWFFPRLTHVACLNFKKPWKLSLHSLLPRRRVNSQPMFSHEVFSFPSSTLSPLASQLFLSPCWKFYLYFFLPCSCYRALYYYLEDKVTQKHSLLNSFDGFLFPTWEYLSERNYSFRKVKCCKFFLSMF